MRVLLRHNRTGHYYNGNSEWAMEAADAKDHGSIDQVLEIVAAERLDGMSVVVRYDEGGREQVFDLSDGPRAEGIQSKLQRE